MSYAELHCVSNFTFLRGASHPEELVERAHNLGYSALALTDECSFAGIVRAHSAAKGRISLIIGTEVKLQNAPRLVLLAQNRQGYGQLSKLITLGRARAKKGSYLLYQEDLSGLSDCLALLIPEAEVGVRTGHWLTQTFPTRAWIAVALCQEQTDSTRLAALYNLSKVCALPLVATGDVHMHNRGRRVVQDTLTAIRLATPLAEAGYALTANGERHLRDTADLAKLYPPSLLAETLHIAARCHFSLDELRYEYPEEIIAPGYTSASYLRQLVEKGMRERWPDGAAPTVHSQIEHELQLISELKYEAYFLTVYDLVRFARSQGILCQGRGSAANSAVCFCLGITEVDPARMEMLFERFISRERNEPPDVDVDFEHERRDEVIQYIYAKYGRDRAGLAATVITYQPKSAMRDVGKALGLNLDQVDQLAKSIAWWDGQKIAPERLIQAGFDPDNPLIIRLMWLVNTLIGFPRHLSQHVGGFVIARGQLSELVPIENAAMPGRTVIQWDKDDLDALGLLKVDCLALGMLSAIQRCLKLVSQHRNTTFSLASIPAEDPTTYEMICKADTVGVFQIESRAQMSMLPRLKPRTFYDLVIQVAIVRPGPIQGDMVHPYLLRRQKKEPVTYPSTEVQQVLQRTLGIPIFQEQVIKLAMVAAGFTPGEADQLRRAMAGWRRSANLSYFEERLLHGMRERGYSDDYAKSIFKQIQGFGEYGFPESHAVSFALLSYVSAWLKCHEPAAFTCALLNSQPMGFYAPAQLIQDVQRHGVEVLPVDVNCSEYECSLSTGVSSPPGIRLGLNLVKGLSATGAKQLIMARAQYGSFENLPELLARAPLSRADLKALAASDAFSAISGHRHAAFWEVCASQVPPPLLKNMPNPANTVDIPSPSEAQDIIADYKSTELSLRRHPMALLRPHLTHLGLIHSGQLPSYPTHRMARISGIVITRQRPYSANGVIFLTLEDEFGTFNIVVWNKEVNKYKNIILNGRLIEVQGLIQHSEGVTHLITRFLVDHTHLIAKLETQSRDFC